MIEDQSMAGIMLVYNPHFHPEFSDTNNMLVSYNLNASKSSDLLYADTYRPRFFRAQISSIPSFVSVSGKVLTAANRAISKANVTLTSLDTGESKTVTTDASGFYKFDNVPTSKTYNLQAYSKHYRFSPKTLSITAELRDVNFVAEP